MTITGLLILLAGAGWATAYIVWTAFIALCRINDRREKEQATRCQNCEVMARRIAALQPPAAQPKAKRKRVTQ